MELRVQKAKTCQTGAFGAWATWKAIEDRADHVVANFDCWGLMHRMKLLSMANRHALYGDVQLPSSQACMCQVLVSG